MLDKTTVNSINLFTQNADRNIATTMEIAEGMFGGNPMWPFFRKTLLRHINDIKRNGLIALESLMDNRNSNTASVGVAVASESSSRLRSDSCRKSC